MLLRFTTTYANQEYVIKVLSKKLGESGKVTVVYQAYTLKMVPVEVIPSELNDKFLEDIRIMFMGQERGYL